MSAPGWALAIALGFVAAGASAQAGELGAPGEPESQDQPAFGDDFDQEVSGSERSPEAPDEANPGTEIQGTSPDEEASSDGHDGPEAEPEPWDPWEGPRVEIAYSYYSLADGHGSGEVHAGQFGGAYTFGRLRLGAYGEFGVRSYALGPDDLVARGSALVGYQHLPAVGNRLIPFAVVEASAGAVFGKRFSTARVDALYGLGLRIGAEVRLLRTSWLGVSVGYLRARVGDLAHNIWNVRVRLGL